MRHKKTLVVLSVIAAFLVAIPFSVTALRNIFVESSQVADIKIGDIPINYVYKGDKLIWERCGIAVNQQYRFNYAGNYQAFSAPCTGTYRVQLWGASGGSSYYRIDKTGGVIAGGNGAYTVGDISLKKGQTFYVYIGGKGGDGTACNIYGGWNGGGNGQPREQCGSGGGGATDIRLTAGVWNNATSLNSRIMVAAAGSGAGSWNTATNGVPGGALYGVSGFLNSANTATITPSSGGTQTSPGSGSGSLSVGAPGSFGGGGSVRTDIGSSYHGSGGSGGYWGGGAGGSVQSAVSGSASGSSYISGHTGSVAITSASDRTPRKASNGTTTCANGTTDIVCSYHYSGLIFKNTQMLTGNVSMPSPNGGTMTGNSGNGVAIVTFISH